jgi:peptidyl-prolyl cis-trans isomerase B (cyclophilin B)
MQQAMQTLTLLFSIIVPNKGWYAPTQPLLINIKHDAPVTLVLTDFHGKAIEANGPNEAAPNKEIDIRPMYRDLAKAGTYVLFAVPKGKAYPEFIGTPVVVQVRSDKRPGMPDEPIVVRMEPLRYLIMSTEHGDMTWIFNYDVAPNTVNTIVGLAAEGYYDGLTFHRIIPGFVLQGGDPHGDGVGGPGFSTDAEFSNLKHLEGVLSMARQGDPLERQGMKPRCEFANSAGSQFFVCLGKLESLDNKYTVFGKVAEGLETMRALAGVPIADKVNNRPDKPPVIRKVEVRAVTPDKNPYGASMVNIRPKEG